MQSFSFPFAFRRPLLKRLMLPALWASGHSLHGEGPPASSEELMRPTVQLAPYVVVASTATSPLEAVFDPNAPAQPLPAQDGADVLKHVPGFAVIRKGGTDGDPVLRGMAGSRLGIRLDGQVTLGGCGARMDPPTAYVFPAAYDRVRILKGPQTVLHGPGQSAGIVLFESDPPVFETFDASLQTQTTTGNWGRVDLAVDGQVGAVEGFARFHLTRTASDDYEDGDGQRVHANHLRWSAHAALGWTPDRETLVQVSAIVSDGEAAYADRLMDGVKFARESVSLRLRRERPSLFLARAEFEIGLSEIDHVMDNYSLRAFAPAPMMAHRTVSNPDRRTLVGRARLDLTPAAEAWRFALGGDHQSDRHRLRRSMNEDALPYERLPRREDAEFSQWGLFGEATHAFDAQRRLVAGLRLDHWRATDHRAERRLAMMGTRPNPTAEVERTETLPSGFLRYEHDLPAGAGSLFLGLGHVARFLDYWELIRNEAPGSLSAFLSEPERTTQLDLGATRQLGERLEVALSAFASEIDDFALVENGWNKPAGAMGTRAAIVTRGIEARTWGGEAGAVWRPGEPWRIDLSLAYTQGKNETDDVPLAQIPPLEARLGVTYRQARWSAGGLLRAVAAQNRVAVGQGNIVGQDLGPTDGFATLALHAAWTPTPRTRLSAGVDNLFDTPYAEHLSRAGAAVAGYPQTTRVNEPGRTLWARLDLQF
ncbi:MAG: TonB-dependent copper receptor [Verrucomicrobiota bacterium]